MKKLQRFLSLALALVLLMPSLAFGQNELSTKNYVDTTQKTLEKLKSDKEFRNSLLDNNLEKLEDVELNKEKDVRVIVETESKPAIYFNRGGQRGLSTEALAQTEVVNNEVQDVINSIQARGFELETLNTYDTTFSGFSAVVKSKNVEFLKKLPGVKKVWISQKYIQEPVSPNMEFSHETIENRSVWTDLGYKGEGTVVAVLDSGIDYRHKDMVLTNVDKAKHTKASVEEVLAKNPEIKGKFFTDKVPFGYNYFDNSYEIIDMGPNASQHGMHVSGTVGANGPLDDAISESVAGVAPETQLLGMKVFGNEGMYSTTYTDVYIKALDDAVKLGAEVANMSLGSPAGAVVDDEPMIATINNAMQNGLLVSISAGNSSYNLWGDSHLFGLAYPYATDPDYGVVGSPSVSKESISVASYENVAMIADLIKYTVEGEQKSAPYVTSSPVSPVGVKGDLVDLGTGSEAEFKTYLETNGQDSLKGKVVLVKRGQTFTETQKRSQEAGAAAQIVYNHERGGEDLVSIATNSGQTLPSLFVGNSTGKDLLKVVNQEYEITNEKTRRANPNGGLMSDFTSRGPAPDLTMKPEISAPGGQIYSTMNNNKYGIMSGTSMAAPHVSGGLSLIRQYLRDNVKFRNKSLEEQSRLSKALMMNSADIIRNPENNVAYNVRTQGAGGMNIRKAVNIPMIATKAGTLDAKFELGVLSSKTLSLDVELTNFTDRALTYKVDTEFVKDNKLTVANNSYYTLKTESLPTSLDVKEVKLEPKETKTVRFTVEIEDEALQDEFVDGWLKFTSDVEVEVVVPVLGFVGNFNGLRVLDRMRFGEGVGQNPEKFGVYAKLNGDKPLTGLWFEDPAKPGSLRTFSDTKVGISPNTDEGTVFGTNRTFPALTYLRNAKSIETSIVDAKHNFVRKLSIQNDTRKNFANRGSRPMYSFDTKSEWNGLKQNKQVKDGLYYYEWEILPYLAKDPQIVRTPVYVDTSRPVVESVNLNENKLEVTATDETTGVMRLMVFLTDTSKEKSETNPKTVAVYATDAGVKDGNKYTIDLTKQLGTLTKAEKDNTLVEVMILDHAMNLSSASLKATVGESQDIPWLYVQTPDILAMNNAKTIRLSGYVIDKEEVGVSYTVNGGEAHAVETTYAPNLKVEPSRPDSPVALGWKFESEIQLEEGYNRVLVTASSKKDREKTQNVTRDVWVDTQKPVVELVDYQKTVAKNGKADVTIRVTEQLNAFEVRDKSGDLISLHNKAQTFIGAKDLTVEHTFKVPVYEEGPYVVQLYVLDAVGNRTDVEEFVINAPEVDKSKLKQRVEELEALNKAVYTDESVAELEKALNSAKEVLANKLASKEQVDEALQNLEKAFEALVAKEIVKKDALTAKVKELEDLDKTPYTAESVAKLAEALKNAKAVLSNEEATQQQVDEQVNALEQAKLQLVEKPVVDKSKLEAKVKELEALDKSKYTEESVVKLNSEIAKAKSVLENKDATEEEVKSALSALELANFELKEKIVEPQPQPTPEQPSENKHSGYAKFTQKIRDKEGKYLNVDLPRNEYVTGEIVENRVKIEYKGTVGYIYLANISKDPVRVKGYAKFTQKIRDEEGKYLNVDLPRNEYVDGLAKGSRVQVKYNGVSGYVYSANLAKDSIKVSGYAKFAQWIRDEKGEKVSVLPLGAHVEGSVKGSRVQVEYAGHKGYVYEVNLSKNPVIVSGYAKFTQNIRDEKGKVVGILRAGHYVSGTAKDGKVRISHKGLQAYVYVVNLEKQKTRYEGVSKFTQNIRDTRDNIVGVLPKGVLVSGPVLGQKVEISYRGVKGFVWTVNLD